MWRPFLLVLTLASGLSLTAQDKSLKEQVLFTVEEDTVTAGEYMAVYNKNRNVGQEIDPKTPAEYLDLYVNFKLKVYEAKQLGKDTLPGFLKEYRQYRDQLAQPYLSDQEVTEELVREAYQRKQYDVRASHIMVELPKEATPQDTLAAYKKIKKIAERLAEGEEFSALAKELSDDTYSAKNGGDLGFFTVFDMVYPFESAAYQQEVGTVSTPVRSQYGYHLVKTTDRRPARGTIRVAHIMLIDNEKQAADQANNAEERIEEIYQELKGGASFRTMAAQYSDDRSSAKLGGILEPFGINKMYPEFEAAAFALQDSGDISEPVKTPVGWHIIKLIDPYEKKSFPAIQNELRNKVERDVRAQQSRESVMKRLKKSYQYREMTNVFEKAFDQVDASLLKGAWSLPEKIESAGQTIIEFGNKAYTVSDFLRWLAKHQGQYRGEGDLQAKLYQAVSDFGQERLLAYEKAQLPEKYPAFRLLDREYYEGILLFDLTNEMVWQAAVKDTVGLKAYYDEHKENYLWPKRIKGYRVDAATKKMAREALEALEEGETVNEVLRQFNLDSKLALAVDSGYFTGDELGPFNLDQLPQGSSKVKAQNERFLAFHTLAVLDPAVKTFKESRGRVVSDYQNHLEEVWIETLREKYEVKVQKETMTKVMQALEE